MMDLQPMESKMGITAITMIMAGRMTRITRIVVVTVRICTGHQYRQHHYHYLFRHQTYVSATRRTARSGRRQRRRFGVLEREIKREWELDRESELEGEDDEDEDEGEDVDEEQVAFLPLGSIRQR